MTETAASPLFISITAFVAVFVILSILALLMKLVTSIFPAPPEDDDAAVIAAIHAAAARAWPGTRVTRIEETTRTGRRS